ncbi:MAG: 4-(cytidine 5'-diphospho)-2-C-methyl-D-erythritol kinase [Opitutales bacterium]|nr:4-(cytidine 5'-diphospho)-2-C-methyl-D-erythritol kinase [Opitutales bacterium]
MISDAPCKLNLMLAITGVREDGFHDLVSLVVPVDFCDTLECETAAGTQDRLFCEMPGVPCDERNLVLRATRLYRESVPELPALDWRLKKSVPHGAGLGGGSSDAATALKVMNSLCGNALGTEDLLAMAAKLGSDVPLFVGGNAVVMRGRGEKIQHLEARHCAALRERRFLIFKPAFGIPTAEIYGKMRRERRYYFSRELAEERLKAWLDAPVGALPLFNNMEEPAFEKYCALPALFALLRERFGLVAHMSGSGSACFVELSANTDSAALEDFVRASWGDSACVRLVRPL